MSRKGGGHDRRVKANPNPTPTPRYESDPRLFEQDTVKFKQAEAGGGDAYCCSL